MSLGLGTGFGKGGIIGSIPGVVTDNLVMKHMYPAGAVQPVSDGAIYFDASVDSYVTASDSSSLDFTDAFSSVCWIMPTLATSDWEFVYGKGDLSDGVQVYKLLQINTDGIYRFELNEASGSRADTTTALQSNQWYHIACTYDKSNTKIYVNGVLEDTTSFSTSISTNSEDLHIGLANVTTSGWKGYICNLGMWAGALTQAQIKSIMWKQYADLTDSEKEAGTTTGTPNIAAWWNLDVETNTSGESGTGGVKDHYGSNHGTISGD